MALTEAPTEALNVALGLHTYVLAPLAVNGLLLPEQIVGKEVDAFTVGLAFIATDTVSVFVQPAELVPVTV